MAPLLLEVAVRALLVATGTALVLWALRIRTAAVKHAAWTAVVIAMLALPLWSASGPKLPLPVLQPPATASIAPVAPGAGGIAHADVVASGEAASSTAAAPATAAARRVSWQSVLLGVYVAGALVLLLRLAIGTLHANRLRRIAVLEDGRATSRRCATPITVGWLSPALILPKGWHQWPAAQLDAVLTHEREHARRHDPLVQWLALFNRAIFWFHPLAWWLERRLATLAEEACDAAVLAAGHSPQDYSEYLLEMARAVTREHGRVHLVGMAMPGSGLTERLRHIFQGLPIARLSRTRVVCTIALCAMSSVLFAAGSLAERATQNPAAPSEKFDVVSIKPCPSVETANTGRGAGPNLAQTSPGHVYWACVTLASLVDQAYAGWDFPLLNNQSETLVFEPFPGRRPGRFGAEAGGDPGRGRVRGGPSWMFSERYAIEATASVQVISPERGNLLRLPAPMNRALRAMLSDRFQLKVRRETEQLPMYALTVAPGGLKIKPPAADDCTVFAAGMPRFPPTGSKPYCGGISQTTPLARLARLLAGEDHAAVMAMPGPDRRIEYSGVTLKAVADQLSTMMDRHVLDQTGVTGEFMLAVEYTRNDNTPNASIGMNLGTGAVSRPPAATDGRDQTIFEALAAFGLKLERTMGPAEYLVIDSVQKPRPDETPAPARSVGGGR